MLNPACEKGEESGQKFINTFGAPEGWQIIFLAACCYMMCLHASVTDDTIQSLNTFRGHSVLQIFTELWNVCDEVQF